MKESIVGHVELALDGHLVTLGVKEVLVYPSAPCPLASSVEAGLMVDFPTSSGEDDLSREPNCQVHVEYGKIVFRDGLT